MLISVTWISITTLKLFFHIAANVRMMNLIVFIILQCHFIAASLENNLLNNFIQALLCLWCLWGRRRCMWLEGAVWAEVGGLVHCGRVSRLCSGERFGHEGLR